MRDREDLDRRITSKLSCPACEAVIKKGRDSVECPECASWYHRRCASRLDSCVRGSCRALFQEPLGKAGARDYDGAIVLELSDVAGTVFAMSLFSLMFAGACAHQYLHQGEKVSGRTIELGCWFYSSGALSLFLAYVALATLRRVGWVD